MSDAAPAVVRRGSVDQPRDVEALAALRYAWCSGEGGESGELADFAPAFADWWRAHADSHLPFIAYASEAPHGSAIGMAWLGVLNRIPGPERFLRRSGMVQSVYVTPAARNRGVGAALLTAVIAEARALRLGYVAVHPSAQSFPLYRRAGFADTSGVLELAVAEPRRP